ncbi:MAG: sodium:proton antiporter [Balneolaceae bacterium]|nr:sodium:proton antiporter [Balneolaceae bacterium]
MTEHVLLGLISIVVFGVGAQWLAWRTKLPAILLLLLAGILAGPVLGILQPDVLMGDLLAPFVSISVGIILFEGGLSLRFSELRDIGGAVIKLVSIGVVVTWVIVSITANYLFPFDLELAVLLGAILVVTGPTVILPLLRQVRPTGQVGSVLKWEGIVIDPIGALLAVLVFEVIFTTGLGEATSLALGSIFKTVFFGTIVGLAGAGIVYLLLKRYMLPDFLQNPVTLMVVFLVFGLSDFLQHESGLWATTVMGIALANQKSARIHHIAEFKENLRVLLLSALFILLAARVELADLMANLNWDIVIFLAVLIFITRPLSVYLSTIGSQLNNREKLFLSWMAPRGVVAASISSLFALQLVEGGYAEAGQLVPIVFIVIIVTVAIYGLTATPLARWLDVAKPVPRGFLILGAHNWARELAKALQDQGFKVLVTDSNWTNINKAHREGLNTYYGNILAEYALDEINLDGIGKLLALTPNDEVNSLAVIRFAEYFGSSEVFQLAAVSLSHRKEREVPDNLSGRILFGEDLNFESLSKLMNEGADFRQVGITETIPPKEMEEKFAAGLLPLVNVKTTGEAIPYSVDHTPAADVGDLLLCLAVPGEHATKADAMQDLNPEEGQDDQDYPESEFGTERKSQEG